MTNTLSTQQGITEATAIEYRRIGKMLLDKYAPTRKSQTAEAFADWLIQNYTVKKPATWRKYRSAIIFYTTEKAPFFGKRLAALLAGHKAQKIERPKKRTKRKNYSEQDFKRLMDYLQKKAASPRHGFWWGHLALTMQVNNIVGLRPCEWERADCLLQDEEIHLVVENAKNTHGRSHGKTRTIRLPLHDEDSYRLIRNKIKITRDILASGKVKSMKYYLKMLGDYLLRANNKVFGKGKNTIALYSTRHQVSANLKKSGASKAEVAAVMGHASEETAGKHYGRKRYGRGGMSIPMAAEEDVARVIQLNTPPSPPPSCSFPSFSPGM